MDTAEANLVTRVPLIYSLFIGPRVEKCSVARRFRYLPGLRPLKNVLMAISSAQIFESPTDICAVRSANSSPEHPQRTREFPPRNFMDLFPAPHHSGAGYFCRRRRSQRPIALFPRYRFTSVYSAEFGEIPKSKFQTRIKILDDKNRRRSTQKICRSRLPCWTFTERCHRELGVTAPFATPAD